MSEQPARQPMTNGEREILFQMQKLFAKWLDTVHMCLDREANHRQRIEELAQNVRDLTREVQELKQQLAKDRLF
jgi:predicted  nucleic acid-binding Zn-ribbon protein